MVQYSASALCEEDVCALQSHVLVEGALSDCSTFFQPESSEGAKTFSVMTF